MAYEKKEFDFTLFFNDDAVGNRPFVSGTIFVNGKEIPIAGWKRTAKSGKQFISGCKSVKKEPAPTKDDWETHDASSEIPF